MPCIMNAANEAAVSAYLKDIIGFYDISDIISSCMDEAGFIADPGLDDIYRTNTEAFCLANRKIDRKNRA